MQKVNLFNYLTNWRIPKWHLNGDGQAGMPAQSGSFHPESWQGCCWHPCVGGLHTCGLAPHSDLPCAFYEHRDRQIKHVHERASTIICYLYTEILDFQRFYFPEERIKSTRHSTGGSHIYSPGLGIPSCRVS